MGRSFVLALAYLVNKNEKLFALQENLLVAGDCRAQKPIQPGQVEREQI